MTERRLEVRRVEGPGNLVLRETGGLLELVAGNVILLSSASLGTERAFGGLAKTVGARSPRRVVIGGLGFGATLRGVLDVVEADATVVVVEKVDAVVDLVRGRLASISHHSLDDPRVKVIQGDVGDVLGRSVGELDVVLLDVDNGPHWASFRTNARLYSPSGLHTAKRALLPGGALAVWSGYRSDGFLGHLRSAGLSPSVVPLHERGRVRARAYVGKLEPLSPSRSRPPRR